MTLEELTQLRHLTREIEMDWSRLENIKKDPTLSEMLAGKLQRCILERKRLEQYIAAIPDSVTRQVFTLRFVEGLEWRQVAQRVGGDHTAKNISLIVYRYLEKH